MKRTLITVVALLSAMTAIVMLSGVVQAAPIAYSIVDYPLSEWDYYGPNQQDKLSGTIIADPSLPDGENIARATFTLSQPGTGKTYTSTVGNTVFDSFSYDFGGYAPHVSSTEITVSDGVALGTDWTEGSMFVLDGIDTATGLSMEMNWNEAGPQYSGGVWGGDPYKQYMVFGNIYVTTPQDGTPDGIAGQGMPNGYDTHESTWVIAAANPVPEPSTLVLLGIGAVSLLAYARRRQERSA